MARASRYNQELIDRNFSNGFWQRTTFYDLLLRNASAFPEKEAVSDSSLRLTWTSLKQRIERLALGLINAGLKKDELVVVQLPNSVELFAVRLACEAAGLLCLPVLRTYRHKEMFYILDYTKAAAVIVPSRYRDFDYQDMIKKMQPGLPELRLLFTTGTESGSGFISLEQMSQKPLENLYPREYLKTTRCPPTEFSLVLLTSGTTGLPKFVENPVCATMLRDRAIMEILKIGEEDVIGVFFPAAGGANARAYYGSIIVGARVVMMEHFDPAEALKLIEKERITIAPLVPAQLIMMARHPELSRYDLRSLRQVLVTGAALPYEVALECQQKFKCCLIPNYSSIDCSVGCVGSPSDPVEVRLRTVGKPFGEGELKIVDEHGNEVPQGEIGEIMLRGPAGASGYYRDPEATRQAWSPDGWFRMGDLGKIHESGNLMLLGRKKDIIIRGGQNIYPIEIENLLSNHPSISAVAVVGMPESVMGEKACAYVVPKQGLSFSFEEMILFLKNIGIAPFKMPERLEIIDRLPYVAGGQKIDKAVLRQDIINKLV
ncbi:MAG: class I adenylate-forming enzyme family protein [Dehalococcoidia bacterium]|nr:class I adenylate-forming enzyme family protein [Dehalococcoidia bacterium]